MAPQPRDEIQGKKRKPIFFFTHLIDDAALLFICATTGVPALAAVELSSEGVATAGPRTPRAPSVVAMVGL